MRSADFEARFVEDRRRVEERLAVLLAPQSEEPRSLHGAMRYSTLDGGKRLRAILCMAAHSLCGDPHRESALDAGCAIECLHAYTLIHDDLPMIDNDDFRRGKPSCHKRYGEQVALMAGDALQALAFEILAGCGAPAPSVAEAVRILSRAAGSRFLVGGQVADIEAGGAKSTEELVRFIHSRKTGELIAASLSIGAAVAGADDGMRLRMHEIGRAVGFAFQIVDDILDVEGSMEKVGKTLRKDDKEGKITYPAHFGIESSREAVSRLIAAATSGIRELGDDGYLQSIFASIAGRSS
ncbi:MAG: polyprenyl synthetase family protein [Candidatus Krumholzibacteria bacterium]|nr:polyprenyl synthetase family protein [Candidatus Krumholzibacteria bacterium]